MFESAIVDEMVESNPSKLKPGELPEKRDKDPGWRSQATVTVHEVERPISDPVIPVGRRVQYAHKAIAGMRHVEVAALTWRALDYAAEPLARINVTLSYCSKTRRVKSTKTEDTRPVPMHPTLAAITAAWKQEHWPRIYGRQPGPDDLVVPTRNGTPVNAGRRRARAQGRPCSARVACRGRRAPGPGRARPADPVQDPYHRRRARLAHHPADHPRHSG